MNMVQAYFSTGLTQRVDTHAAFTDQEHLFANAASTNQFPAFIPVHQHTLREETAAALGAAVSVERVLPKYALHNVLTCTEARL